MNNYYTCLIAEYVALFIYKMMLYRILHHRYKTYVGEVDLIVQRGHMLVFIEVKARKYGIDFGIVSVKQQKRIRRTAELFVAKNPKFHGFDMRFDLVVLSPRKWPVVIKGAW
jgi:putative endonuclease